MQQASCVEGWPAATFAKIMLGNYAGRLEKIT